MTRTGDRDVTRPPALASLGAALALGALAPSRVMAATEDWPAGQAAALKEGKLSFYHNLPPQGVEPFLVQFRKANPGIQTEQIRLGSAPLIERFSTEFNAGRNLADAMLTFPDDAMFAGVDKSGWATEWTPPELSAFDPAVNHANKIFAVHTSRNVIIYNKQRVKP